MAVTKRILLHFPGFEPLDARQHHDRYQRVAAQAGPVWNCRYIVSSLEAPPDQGTDGASFHVQGSGPNWQADTVATILDHNDRIRALRAPSLPRQLLAGFKAGLDVMLEGGLVGYFRAAWRFGLFYIVPVASLKIITLLSLVIMLLPAFSRFGPLAMAASIPAGLAFLTFAFRFSERFYVMHLLADWRLAVSMARLPAEEAAFIDRLADRVIAAVTPEADEILITSHSMGASVATQVIGRVLERQPSIFDGRTVGFVTLGGAILQCSLLRSATVLRRRLEAIARHRSITFLEVQSLNDVVNFYRAKTVALSGLADAPQADILAIRLKHLISKERRKRIGFDAMRIHRQYVLAPDLRGGFDFTFLTAGPLSVRDYVGALRERRPLPVGADGRLLSAAVT